MRFKSAYRRINSLVETNWPPFLAAIAVLGFLIRVGPYLSVPGYPYGGYDAAYHFEMARLISEGGYPRFCVGCLNTKSFFGDYFYPPGFHTLAALQMMLSQLPQTGSIYLSAALADTLLIITTFMLVRELWGVSAALACSSAVAVSFRNFQSVLWGQWPSFFGIAFIPLIMLFGWRGIRDRRSMAACGLVAGLAFTVYPQWSLHAAAVVALVHLYLARRRGLRWFASNMAVFCAVVVLASVVPFMYMRDYIFGAEVGGPASLDVSRLLSWYPPLGAEAEPFGYPRDWFSISVYPHIILLLFLVGFGGALVCVRDERLLLPVANASVFYVFAHLDILGIASMGRVVSEYHMESLVPILFIPCAFHLKEKKRQPLTYMTVLALAAASLAFGAFWILPASMQSYPSETRLTDYELAAASWVKANTPQTATVKYLGGVPQLHWKWFNAFCDRRIVDIKPDGVYFEKVKLNDFNIDYVIFDYNPNFNPASRNPGAAKQYANALYDSEQALSNITKEVYANDYVAVRKFV